MLGSFDRYNLLAEYPLAGPQDGIACSLPTSGSILKAPGLYEASGPAGATFLLRLLAPCTYYDFPDDFVVELRKDQQLAGELPHLLPLYATAEQDGVIAFVYRWDRGWTTLRRQLETTGSVGISELQALRIARDVTRGLVFLHTQQISHLQVRPENIVLQGEGEAMLADLGIHRGYLKVPPVTVTLPLSLVKVAWPYMPPEVLDDSANADPSADIWSVGVLLYEMLTGDGCLPFKTLNPDNRYQWRTDILRSVFTGTLHGPAQRIARRCTSIEPTQRYSSAKALLADLDKALLAFASQVQAQDATRALPSASPASVGEEASTAVTATDEAEIADNVAPQSFVVSDDTVKLPAGELGDLGSSLHDGQLAEDTVDLPTVRLDPPALWPVADQFSDIVLTCVDCGSNIPFPAEKQRDFARKGFLPPKRCSSCRGKHRLQKIIAAKERVRGSVKFFKLTEYYGFIVCEHKEVAVDIFFHGSTFPTGIMPQPRQQVTFRIRFDDNGRPQAYDIAVTR